MLRKRFLTSMSKIASQPVRLTSAEWCMPEPAPADSGRTTGKAKPGYRQASAS